MTEIKLKEFSVPIIESASVDGEFVINGIAINETTTSNGHVFIAEELRPAAQGMIGIPLLKDHVNSIDSIMGRVKDARFDELDKNIPFRARVNDKKAQELIKRGDLNSVSVGATCEDLEETDEGTLLARGIQIKELSLVAVPADGGATFGVALKEALDFKKSEKERKKSESLSEDNTNIIEKGGEDRVTEEETKKPSEEPKTEEPKENVEAKLLKKELVEANKKLAEFAAKERTVLEKDYSELCANKKVKALDISAMDNSVVELLLNQVKEMADVDEEKPKEEKVEPVKEEPEDDSEEDVEEKIAFEEGNGSLGGKRLTLIRNY